MRDEEKKEFVYLNGSLVPKEDAKISVFDRGFLYGDGVFETVRIYYGRPFMGDEHITRLLNGLKALRFQKLPAGLKVHSEKVIEANGVKNGVLRIEVTRGEAPDSEPTVVITAKDAIPYAEELYEKGFKAIISKIRKDHRSPICNIKSANFLIFLLAKEEAAGAGADEAILLNNEGFVAEGSVSNIFIVNGGTVITPSIESGILPGITRKVVMELVIKMGLKIEEEREVRPEELIDADEAFLTNSLMELMPLIEIDKRPVGNGLPGKITIELRKRYQSLCS